MLVLQGYSRGVVVAYRTTADSTWAGQPARGDSRLYLKNWPARSLSRPARRPPLPRQHAAPAGGAALFRSDVSVRTYFVLTPGVLKDSRRLTTKPAFKTMHKEYKDNTHEHGKQSDQTIQKLKRFCRGLVVVRWTIVAIFTLVKVVLEILKLIGLLRDN